MWTYLYHRMVRMTFLILKHYSCWMSNISSKIIYTFICQLYLFVVLMLHYICDCNVAKTCSLSSSLPVFLCCCLSVCPERPNIPHASVTQETKKAQYVHGDVIFFTCETGYVSGPSIKYACTDEGWLLLRGGTCNCKLIGFLLYAFETYCCYAMRY